MGASRFRSAPRSSTGVLALLVAVGALAPLHPVRAGQEARPAARLEADDASGHKVAGASTYRIRSGVLNQTRRVFVATPESFANTSRRYPVILAFDGEYLFPDVLTAATYLAQEGQIPEAILVGIENLGGPDDRVHDLTPPGLSVSGSGLKEGGDRFLDFIQQELLPALETQFRAGKPCALVGLSSGAILTTYAGATRGSAFPFIVALDAPTHLGDDWLPARMLERASKDTGPPLRFATFEARYGWRDKKWQELQAAAPKTWRLHREKLAHESHNSMRLLGSYLGLRHVFGDYSMLDWTERPGARALEHYRSLEKEYGAAQPPPRALLLQLFETETGASRVADARAVLDSLHAAYGKQPKSDAFEARVKEIASRPPPKETVASLLNTPRPTPEEVKNYLGEWTGQAWVNDGPRHPIRLRVFLDDGKVKHEFTHILGKDTVMRMPDEYLTVTEAGLAFGHMNGMNPKGVIVFDGHLNGNVLEGVSKIRGVQFSYPPGVKPPVHHFRLERGGTP